MRKKIVNFAETEDRERSFTHPSSFVGTATYTPEMQSLQVKLKNTGKTYGFCGVPERTFDSFEGSPSKGAFFNFLKNQYACTSFSETTDSILASKMQQRVAELYNRGIPYDEIRRVVAAEFADGARFDPPVENRFDWPPDVTGIDSAGTIEPLKIPDTGYPPVLPELAIKTEPYPPGPYEPYLSENLSIPGELSPIKIPEDNQQNKNYTATGAKVDSQPSMHNEEGWVGDKQIPEESFYPKVQEAVQGLQTEFDWFTPEYANRIKKLDIDGHWLLIRASAETITDHRGEGEPYRRKLSGDELHSLTRTAIINNGVDINHFGKKFKVDAQVADAEYDKKRKQSQFLVHLSDEEIFKAIDEGKIEAVSINGGAPRREDVGPCNDDCNNGCEMCMIPQGVVLGEQDGIAFTFVVTDPDGMMWQGQHIPKAEPGVKTTAIEIL